jgi:hypothetical protein
MSYGAACINLKELSINIIKITLSVHYVCTTEIWNARSHSHDLWCEEIHVNKFEQDEQYSTRLKAIHFLLKCYSYAYVMWELVMKIIKN